jgi:hypothetical protein
MAIRVSGRRRLARLAGPRLWQERNAVEERVKLRDRHSFSLFVAILLDIEGVDPESTCIMDCYREAEAGLDAIPDTPELEWADEEYLARWDASWIDDLQRKSRYRPPLREEKTVEGEAERLMKRYRTGGEIDFAKAPAFDLFAWCLSRRGETYEEAAAACETAAKDLLLRLDRLPDDPTEEDIERALSAEENQ